MPIKPERNNHRDRAWLDLAHKAPCFIRLSQTCGNHASVPCHSEMLKHDRGVGKKSHPVFMVPGCPDCHAIFTRNYLGREGYEVLWAAAHDAWLKHAFDNGWIRVVST